MQAKRADRMEAAGAQAYAEGEKAISTAKADGEKAYNQLAKSNVMAAKRVDSLEKRGETAIANVEAQGKEAYQALEKSTTMHAKRVDVLEKQGADEVASLRKEMAEISGNGENSNAKLRKDGEQAYNQLARSATMQAKRADRMEAAGAQAYAEGKAAVAAGEKAYEQISKSNILAAKRVDALEASGTAAVDELRKEISEAGSNGQFDIIIDEEARRQATQAVAKVYEDGQKAVNEVNANGTAAVETLQDQIAMLQAQIDDLKKNGGGNDGANTSDISDKELEIADNRAKIEEIYKAGDAAAKWAERVADGAYTELDTKIAGNSARIGENTKRIDGLESEMKAMGDNMLALEDRMDGVVATSHAVANARPVLSTAGEYGVGVGMGASGSKKALALGGAYQINANWSTSMTVNYETAGKRTKSNLSAGAGVQYKFK